VLFTKNETGERMTATTQDAAAEKPAAPPEMVDLTIDGVAVSVPKDTLIIRAAEQVGIEIPRFCDHPGLDPVGACRQCLVEVAMPAPRGQPVQADAEAAGLVHHDGRPRHGRQDPATPRRSPTRRSRVSWSCC
jgi:ferredoxin